MEPTHSFCGQSTNGTSTSLKGEWSFLIIRDLGDPYRIISSKPFALCFRNVLLLCARDFVPTSDLRRLHACIYCTMFSVKKVQFMLGSAHSRRQSKSLTCCSFFGTARSSDEPGTEWVRSCYNRRQIVVLFRISVCSSLSPIARWGSRKSQIKNWHRKVSDFDHLVCQRNPQSAGCTQKYCIYRLELKYMRQ
jgi:hypothetical protein